MGSSPIGYLTFNEKAWSNLLRRQVIDVLVESNKQTNKDLILISFLPFYEYLRSTTEISDLRTELENNNIQFITIPTPFPIPIYSPQNGWVNRWRYDWIRMIIVVLYSIPFLIIFRLMYGIKILHCRSYPVSVSALILKKIFKSTNIIFDPRSDFPEENVTRGNWSEDSLNYGLWKILEKKLCDHSDVVIAISSTYDKHYTQIHSDTNTRVIPNNVNTAEFDPSPDHAGSLREKYNINMNTSIICYSGSMYDNLWNNPDEYGCALDKILELDLDVIFLFLIPSESNQLLTKKLNQYEIDEEKYIIENPSFDEVPILLSQADLGLYILDNSSIRIGTKFVEYCSAGLPTIANQNVEGAAKLIQTHGLGTIISLSFNKKGRYCPEKSLSPADLKKVQSLMENAGSISKDCRDFAEENFDTTVVASEYVQLYNELSK